MTCVDLYGKDLWVGPCSPERWGRADGPAQTPQCGPGELDQHARFKPTRPDHDP